MIPLKDDNPTRTFPFVNYALIAACVAVFFWELSLGGRAQNAILAYGLIPDMLLGDARLPPGLAVVPAWATIFTSMFMHGGWMHLIGNMLYLWIFGDNVEDAMGRGRYLVFYVLCGVVAALAQIAVNPDSQIPSLGASGAISGVLGAYLVMFPGRRVRVLLLRMITYLPAIVVIGFWIVLQFISGIGQLAQTEETGGVAYAAHVGGFVAGFVLVWLFRRRRRV